MRKLIFALIFLSCVSLPAFGKSCEKDSIQSVLSGGGNINLVLWSGLSDAYSGPSRNRALVAGQ